MVRKAAREYSKTKELREAAKAAFRWQGTCYGAFTIPGGNLSPEFAFKKEKAVMTYAIITVFSYVPSGNRTHN